MKTAKRSPRVRKGSGNVFAVRRVTEPAIESTITASEPRAIPTAERQRAQNERQPSPRLQVRRVDCRPILAAVG
jgi:hypothetical protein